ncbi:alpha-protein kinase 1-like isoform X2 [Daphnia pulex]|nr:alpha-protein kinase 1-like isoform X2 [Daphnia pulex]XP_046451184.1 alpha-protein kinase 1-like isoform X2 [Daphnia pulex]XP_046451192.1 alpha-protein kinase 1-like isoform X2 [Daphnia pulex]
MEGRIEELERELKETSEQLALTREQLRLQSRRARQLVAACSTKVEEKEREMRMLRVLKDGQLQSIVRKLLHFESLLRQEQKRVVDIVRQKDHIIWTQSTELDQLRQANRKLLMAANQDPEDLSAASNPAASKMAKLDPENKENVAQNEHKVSMNPQQMMETPLVTKMVRRFEPAAVTKKPEIPKKPARLLASVAPTPVVAQPPQTSPVLTSAGSKAIVRTDSVNDHGYFTLEKRKPVRMSVTPTPVQVSEPQKPNPSPRDPPTADRVVDEMDLRNNFEEFHLMDSLEEEEQQQQQQQQHLFQQKQQQHCPESTLMTTTPPRTPDRSSGDGAEWNSSANSSSGGSSSLQMTPPHNGLGDCTSLSISAGSVQILPQLGDATPTSGVQFDRFLDASGLTQKSILTPSRLLSNHKNMLKPKDVKHRHMINKATHATHAPNAFNCRSSESLLLSALPGDPARLHHHHHHHHHHSTNQVRYYVEPFL